MDSFTFPTATLSPDNSLLKRTVFFLAVVLFFGLASIWVAFADESRPSVGRPVADFSLVDQHNQSVTKASLEGKVLVVDFIFTRCPDACWNMTQELVGLIPLLQRYQDLRFVSFSTDPAYDTPAVFSRYAEKAHALQPHWIFLTGPLASITRVAHSFLLATLTPDTDILSHSTEFALVDRHGIIRGYYDLDDKTETAALPHQVEQLLQN